MTATSRKGFARMHSPLMSIAEVSKRLGETPHAVYRMAREGLIPHVRLGRKVKVDQAALEQWIATGGTSLPPSGDQSGA